MKNIRRQIHWYALAFLLLILMTNCGILGGGAPYFDVITTKLVNGLAQRDPNVRVEGSWSGGPTNCTMNPFGNLNFGVVQPAFTDSNGVFRVNNAAISCQWNVGRPPTLTCPLTPAFIYASGQIVQVPACTKIRTFVANPDVIDLTAGPPPPTFDITGDGMDATYATPIVRFYNQNLTVLLEVAAVGTSPDGTWLQVPSSQINFPDGSYAAVIYSMQADGTWNAVGGADISVFNPPPPPPPDPGPCGDPSLKSNDCPLPLQ